MSFENVRELLRSAAEKNISIEEAAKDIELTGEDLDMLHGLAIQYEHQARSRKTSLADLEEKVEDLREEIIPVLDSQKESLQIVARMLELLVDTLTQIGHHLNAAGARPVMGVDQAGDKPTFCVVKRSGHIPETGMDSAS